MSHGNRRVRTLPVLLIAALGALIVPCLAQAQGVFFGQMTPLGTRAPSGLELAGVYAGVATDDIGATGQLRFGIGRPDIDLGVQAGLASVGPSGGKTTALGGQVDVKASLFHPSASNRNIHIGGDGALFVSHETGVTDFGLTAIPEVSFQSGAGGGQVFSGWGGLGLEWVHTSVSSEGFSASGSSTSGVILLGGGYDFTSTMGLAAEFHHFFAGGGSSEFMAGINFGLKGGPVVSPTPGR